MDTKTIIILVIVCLVVIGISSANIYYYNTTLSFINNGNPSKVSSSNVSSTIIANGVAIALAICVLIFIFYSKMKSSKGEKFEMPSAKLSSVKMSSLKAPSSKSSSVRSDSESVSVSIPESESLKREEVKEIEKEVKELLPLAKKEDEIVCEPMAVPACRIERAPFQRNNIHQQQRIPQPQRQRIQVPLIPQAQRQQRPPLQPRPERMNPQNRFVVPTGPVAPIPIKQKAPSVKKSEKVVIPEDESVESVESEDSVSSVESESEPRQYIPPSSVKRSSRSNFFRSRSRTQSRDLSSRSRK